MSSSFAHLREEQHHVARQARVDGTAVDAVAAGFNADTIDELEAIMTAGRYTMPFVRAYHGVGALDRSARCHAGGHPIDVGAAVRCGSCSSCPV
jgi:hypothetical protein